MPNILPPAALPGNKLAEATVVISCPTQILCTGPINNRPAWGLLEGPTTEGTFFLTINAEEKRGDLENVSNSHSILLKVVPYGKLCLGTCGHLEPWSCRTDHLETNPISTKAEMPLSSWQETSGWGPKLSPPPPQFWSAAPTLVKDYLP